MARPNRGEAQQHEHCTAPQKPRGGMILKAADEVAGRRPRTACSRSGCSSSDTGAPYETSNPYRPAGFARSRRPDPRGCTWPAPGGRPACSHPNRRDVARRSMALGRAPPSRTNTYGRRRATESTSAAAWNRYPPAAGRRGVQWCHLRRRRSANGRRRGQRSTSRTIQLLRTFLLLYKILTPV